MVTTRSDVVLTTCKPEQLPPEGEYMVQITLIGHKGAVCNCGAYSRSPTELIAQLSEPERFLFPVVDTFREALFPTPA